MNYNDYLNSLHWRETRKKRLGIDEYKCTICESTQNLNVHHINYTRLGKEDIDNDLVTLCHQCHAMLHRVKEQNQKAYNDYLNAEKIYLESRTKELFDKAIRLLIVEIWLRDVSSGGDIQVFDTGCKMVGKLSKITKIIYPTVNFPNEYYFNIKARILDKLVLARAMKICELYKKEKSISRVADKMKMRPPNVQKILKRHGFNLEGKIK